MKRGFEHTPSLHTLRAIADMLANPCTLREIQPNRWVPARPMGYWSLRKRIRLAWMVFTGKADALTWPGQPFLSPAPTPEKGEQHKSLGDQARLTIVGREGTQEQRKAVDAFFEQYWINPWLHWSRFYVVDTLKHGLVSLPISKDGVDFLQDHLDRLGVTIDADRY